MFYKVKYKLRIFLSHFLLNNKLRKMFIFNIPEVLDGQVDLQDLAVTWPTILFAATSVQHTVGNG